jgi:magnesium transporter
MVKIYYRNIKESRLETLQSFRVGSWVHVEAPTDAELLRLSKTFGLEEGHLRDAVDPYEVPRMETEGDTIYIFTRFPYREQENILTTPLLIVIGKDFVATISQKPCPAVERLLSGSSVFYTTQKAKFFLQLFSQVNNSYNFFVNTISKKVRGMSAALEHITSAEIGQFVAFEDVLNDFLSSLVPTNAVLQNLLSGKTLKLYEEDKDLVEDLFLQNGQLIEISRANLKTLMNVRDSYSTITTHNLNRTIRILTSLTIILTFPTMIINLYGMNVRLPFAQDPRAFYFVGVFVVLLSLGLVWLFRKKRWM